MSAQREEKLKDNVLIETEPEDSEFIEEHGEPVTYVVQKVLYN